MSRSVRRPLHIVAWTQHASSEKRGGMKIMHIFTKVGNGKIWEGAKKIKLFKHAFALQSSSHFLKSFLARYALSIAFSYPNASMQREFPMSLPEKNDFLDRNCFTVLMRQRITVIAQNLILYKTRLYFVENRNENTNKKTLL